MRTQGPCPDRSHSPRWYRGRWTCPDCTKQQQQQQHDPAQRRGGGK